MKRLMLIVLASLMLTATGCGSSVSVGVTIPIDLIESPSITSSRFSQDLNNQFIDGTVDFYAPDADIDTITIAVVDSNGFLIERQVTPVIGYGGVVTGTISFTIDYITYPSGIYTFTVYLTDSDGFISNSIFGTFRV